MFRALLFPLLTVLGDMCQDFCVERLGRGPCSEESFCNADDNCYNLFWLDETKTEICILSDHGECTSRYPVLCHEASRKKTRLTSPVALTSTVTPSISETPTAQVVTSSQPVFRSPALITTTPPDADTGHSLYNRDNVVMVELHFRGESARNYPYIKLSFQNEGRNLGYYAIFDSGTDKTYIFVESESNPFNRTHSPSEPRILPHSVGDPITRPANESEGYRLLPGVVPRNPRTLVYGTDGAYRRFESLGTINDTITVFSGALNQFTFHAPEIHMVRPSGDAFRALFGAGPGSAFATAAEVFAVAPASPANPWLDSDWHLLIGRNSTNYAQDHCSSEDPNLRWYPQIYYPTAWVIGGLMWLSPGNTSTTPRESSRVQNIRMVLDTAGTLDFLLTPFMMDAVIEGLESFGPRRIPSEEPNPRFENCTESLSRNKEMLKLRIQPGTYLLPEKDPLILDLSIAYDLWFFEHNQCQLNWKVGTWGAPNTVVIGPRYISRFVTVFDNVEHRIGVCRNRFPMDELWSDDDDSDFSNQSGDSSSDYSDSSD
jgi:hypothetical protein